MKKNLIYGAFAAGLLLASSCQSEDISGPLTANESVVSFTLEQPGIASRTYSDGLKATKLTYAVYEAGSKTPLIVSDDTDANQVTFSSKTASVSLRLVTGKTYDILFWADNEAAPYTFDETTQTITVDYTTTTSQDENRDAFFAAEKSLHVDGAINKTITLYRPFAQLNIGTTDATESSTAAFTPTHSEVTVKNVYTTLNLFDGKVSNETGLTYAMANIPGSDEKFPVDNVKYLSMNYLLVDAEKEVVDIDFTVTDGLHNIEREYTSVPVQRNYRTNIYGKLLTDPADFTINIEEEYEEPDYEVVVWDGKTITKPASNDTEWTITTAAEWIYLKNNGVQNKNIKLAANIDFGGHEVKGLGFDGEFDGQGFTMSNMTLLCGGSYYSNGLFQGDASGSVTVKNVTIENVTAECSNPDQGYVGTIFGDVQNGTVTLSDVHVKNANLCGVQSVGGLVGFVASGATLNVENCTVDGSALSNYAVENESGYVAGLVGRPASGSIVNVSNYAVTNSTVEAYYAPRRGEASIQAVVGDNTTLTADSDVVVKKTSLENAVYPANAEELNTATLVDDAVVILPEGNFDIPKSAVGKDITFTGSGDAEKTVINPHGGFNGATFTFENVAVTVASNASYTGSQHIAGATYKNCIIEGQIFLYGPSTFKNCTFNNTGDNYNVWTYGTSSKFIGCTFNCDAKAVLIYTEGAVTAEYIFDKCTFNDSGKLNELKAAIEIGESANGNEANYTVRINNCKVNGFSKTGKDGQEYSGEQYGTNVWGNKNSIPADRLHIWIDGTEVY